MEQLALRIPETAALLGISRSKLYSLISSGEVPVLKVGRSLRIPAEALREWVKKQTQAPRRSARL